LRGTAILVAASTLFIALVSIGLSLTLFRPNGLERLALDWERLQLSQALENGADPAIAFNQLYGGRIGQDARPERIKAWFQAEMTDGSPLVLDAVLTAYLERRPGRLDGRSLPPGVYVGAGPIGPDVWPMPIVSHYFFFPRHGYVLIVPFETSDGWPPAVEVTASVDRDFDRAGRPAGDLYAVRDVYDRDAFDFARPGVPVHDLFVVTQDPEEVREITDRLDAAVSRLSKAELPYRLFRRNSNGALGCFLRVAGVRRHSLDRLRSDPMLRLRLPGILGDVWERPTAGAPAECVASRAR
jgi:hypothetical protein